ncbi:MAG: hypothetical protein CSA86_04980 [Arcobacter sp.]|nr:MAG: hypothetical protein CSA86_04980 [Arcobacter sp.]
MEELTKTELVEEIQHLISVDGTNTQINPNYLEYFTIEELLEIKEDLLFKKANTVETTKEYINELYEKLVI